MDGDFPAFFQPNTERAIAFDGPARHKARSNTKETPLSESAMFRMKTRLFSIARKALKDAIVFVFNRGRPWEAGILPLNYSRSANIINIAQSVVYVKSKNGRA